MFVFCRAVNQETPSLTIRCRSTYVPGVVGAVMVTWIVTEAPGATLLGKLYRRGSLGQAPTASLVPLK